MDINAKHPMGPVVYLDNAATTKVDAQVADLAREAMLATFGNPSSAHRLGGEAARAVDRAREQVARAIGAAPAEILFTSGGTEANALGFGGAARAARGRHLVVTALEHPSIEATARRLALEGWAVETVRPNPGGWVSAEALRAAVQGDTAAVALIWVQNELGTVQPVHELAQAIKARAPRCHVHVDAVQAIGKLAVDVASSGVDSLALSGHKLHAPKGVGALWLRPGARVEPLLVGGGQERGLRAGTENVPGVVALGLAVELAERARGTAAPKMAALRDRLWAGISEALPEARRHGDPARAAPHILSVGFPGLSAEPLLHALEAQGVVVSAGSACHARERKPSPVLTAIGVPEGVGTLRFSLSGETTLAEIASAVSSVTAAAREVRG
jgi:cysteine desulfurase